MVVLGALPMAASAEEASSTFSWGDVTFQPRVYAGYADYELKTGSFTYVSEDGSSFIGSPKFNRQFDTKLPLSGFIGGIGGTAAIGHFFGDFYYQSTLNQAAYSSIDGQDSYFVYHFGDVDATPYDWALSLGYIITDQWSVFAGYKSGKTNWDQSYNFYVVDNYALNANGSIDGKFEQNGPFLGTSYSFQAGPGVLTFKIAYAYLDGEYNGNYQERVTVIPPPDTIYYSSIKLDGSSNAYSLGLSWTQSLTDNFGYSIGLNYHRYDFGLSGGQTSLRIEGGGTQIGNPNDEVTNGTLTEELFTLTAAMTYRF